jgi:large subunit ribosomal protein L10
MPNQKKIQIVSSLVEKIKQSPNFVLIYFEDIPHQKMEQLRKTLRPLASSFQVVKNALFKVAALKVNKKEIIGGKTLEGTSALLSLPCDWANGLSAFWKFAKIEGKLSFKIGIIDGKIYQKDDLTKLAQLPPKEELIGKIITIIQSPQRKLVYTMKFGTMRVINIIKKIENSY